MAGHYPEIIGIILLLVFAGTMFYQGTMILRGQRGYRHCEREKYQLESTRKQLENLLKDK